MSEHSQWKTEPAVDVRMVGLRRQGRRGGGGGAGRVGWVVGWSVCMRRCWDVEVLGQCVQQAVGEWQLAQMSQAGGRRGSARRGRDGRGSGSGRRQQGGMTAAAGGGLEREDRGGGGGGGRGRRRRLRAVSGLHQLRLLDLEGRLHGWLYGWRDGWTDDAMVEQRKRQKECCAVPMKNDKRAQADSRHENDCGSSQYRSPTHHSTAHSLTRRGLGMVARSRTVNSESEAGQSRVKSSPIQ